MSRTWLLIALSLLTSLCQIPSETRAAAPKPKPVAPVQALHGDEVLFQAAFTAPPAALSTGAAPSKGADLSMGAALSKGADLSMGAALSTRAAPSLAAAPDRVTLRFAVYDAATAGAPIAPASTHEAIVARGQVAARIRFGRPAADLAGRWLEVSIVDPYGRTTVLAPRRQIDGSPRPLRLEGGAFALDAVVWPGGATVAVGSGADAAGVAGSDADESNAGRWTADGPTDAAADDGGRLAGAGGYGELMNISTRAFVGRGDAAMISGFIVDQPTVVLIRALGPSLAASGVPGALADPWVQLYRGQAPIAENDDWQDSEVATAVAQTFRLAPSHPYDAVLVAVLDRGAYTAIVRGVDGATGIGLVEVFQLGRAVLSMSQLRVSNETGAAFCYEVLGSGIGEKCFGPGEYSYGVFPSGSFAYRYTGVCGGTTEVRQFPAGNWVHRFWCAADGGVEVGGAVGDGGGAGAKGGAAGDGGGAGARMAERLEGSTLD